MYSLFVTYLAAEQSTGTFTIERERFFEYTDDKIRVPLRGLSNEAIKCLCSLPCLLMEEGRSDEVGRVVQITQVSATSAEVKLTVQALPTPIEITNDAIWKLRSQLDIGQFEFSRNHWAVKERDLLAVLTANGTEVEATVRVQFTPQPLPGISRSDLLRVRDAIAVMEHREIDDLIVLAGIGALKAGREVGSRRARADAIRDFALGNPEAVTEDNSLFSHFLVEQTGSPPSTNAGNGGVVTQPTTTTPTATSAVTQAATTQRSPNRVFIVHGRNEAAREAVVLFLDSIRLQGIVLHEQPNMGRHLLTKFIEEAELVTFAVVLMTDDDVGGLKDGELSPRSRQNVILELGYFLAHLGQPNVCALISPGLETPSDFDGIAYIQMAADERWKRELLRELRAANMPVITEVAPAESN